MIHKCYYRHDISGQYPFSTVRIIGGELNREELESFLKDEDLPIKICTLDWKKHEVILYDYGRAVIANHGDFLVKGNGGHIRAYTEERFFEEFYLE